MGKSRKKERRLSTQKRNVARKKRRRFPDDCDEFDAVDIYNQICEQRRKRGYVDYSELRFWCFGLIVSVFLFL